MMATIRFVKGATASSVIQKPDQLPVHTEMLQGAKAFEPGTPLGTSIPAHHAQLVKSYTTEQRRVPGVPATAGKNAWLYCDLTI
jgi:hypothetical protein